MSVLPPLPSRAHAVYKSKVGLTLTMVRSEVDAPDADADDDAAFGAEPEGGGGAVAPAPPGGQRPGGGPGAGTMVGCAAGLGCCCSHDDDHAKRPRALAEVGGHKGERRSARPFTTHSWVSGNARSSRERDETTSDKPRFALQLQLQLQLYSLVTTNPITTVLYF